ncbi:hypothetical protein, partial [Azonexus hydrophilus]|uniref:hypothetical protein n=1 Tax=Azonexus hydrophilus TaxID=418702 RepID=UPI002491F9B2
AMDRQDVFQTSNQGGSISLQTGGGGIHGAHFKLRKDNAALGKAIRSTQNFTKVIGASPYNQEKTIKHRRAHDRLEIAGQPVFA